MRVWFILLGVCYCCALFGQDRHAERSLRKAGKGKPIEKVRTRYLEEVRSVSYRQYADSVFPNEALLRLKNLESVFVVGRTWEQQRKRIGVPPIRLRIDTVKLKELAHLKYVSLSGFNLSVPPEGLASIAGLQGLEIFQCMLDSLPKDVGRMRYLRALALRVNYLGSLPPEIAELDSLRSIDLNNDHFREVPLELTGCASLERIYLSNDESGHMDREGAEREFFTIGFDWPFPLCANHIDWRTDEPQLSVLLEGPKLEYIRLHARDRRDQKAARAKLGSKKIRFRSPSFLDSAPDPSVPYDPDQRKCICARRGH